MAQPNFKDLLAKVELCRSTLDSAVFQLTALEKAVRHLMNGSPSPGAPEAIARSTSKMRNRPKETRITRETHIARSVTEVDRATRHMPAGLEGHFNNVLEKHRGTEAVLSQYQTGLDGSLVVDKQGRPIRRGDEDFGADDEDDFVIPF